MKRILLINQYFPPDTSATARVAEGLVRCLAGRFDVTVLAGRPSYDPSERHPYYFFRRRREEWGAIERVGSSAGDRRKMFWRAANYLSYALLAFFRALTSRADAYLAMSDPPLAGLIAWTAGGIRRRPYVYNVQDLHPDMALASGLIRRGPSLRLWEALHRRALRGAGRVIVLGDDMRRRVVAKGVDPARVAVVRGGASLSPAAPPDLAVVRRLRGPFKFVVLHAGNLGHTGAWETLIGAARALEGTGAGLVFVGGGARREEVERRAAGLSNVRFDPFRPEGEIPSVMAAGDLHVVTIRRGLEGLVVPSKLYGILAAGRPVLAVTPEESDAARIVRDWNCGFVADPDDPSSVEQSVRWALADPGALADMGRRARLAAEKFDRKGEVERFAGVVKEIFSGS
jgi:glycosyltransferase involved in cell wall biosynthesis